MSEKEKIYQLDESTGDIVEETHNLREVLASRVKEEERPDSSSLSVRKILTGEFFSTDLLKRNRKFLILVFVLIVVYIAERYYVQQDLIRIDKLKKEQSDARYRALSVSGKVTEKCRESNVMRQIKHGPDSAIHVSSLPPFIIEVPQE